jgi:hypothetical protein
MLQGLMFPSHYFNHEVELIILSGSATFYSPEEKKSVLLVPPQFHEVAAGSLRCTTYHDDTTVMIIAKGDYQLRWECEGKESVEWSSFHRGGHFIRGNSV